MREPRTEPVSEAAFPWHEFRVPVTFASITMLPQIALRYDIALLHSFPGQMAIVTCAMLVCWPLLCPGYRRPITFAVHARHAVSSGLIYAALQQVFSNTFWTGPVLAIVFAMLLEFVPLRPVRRSSL